MVKKCCMRPNFCNGENLTVYRFPSEVTEPDNREDWIRVCRKIRKDLVVGQETNIFIKNYCRKKTPRTSQESKLKLLKFSEDK